MDKPSSHREEEDDRVVFLQFKLKLQLKQTKELQEQVTNMMTMIMMNSQQHIEWTI
jgi:hypothetical protein